MWNKLLTHPKFWWLLVFGTFISFWILNGSHIFTVLSTHGPDFLLGQLGTLTLIFILSFFKEILSLGLLGFLKHKLKFDLIYILVSCCFAYAIYWLWLTYLASSDTGFATNIGYVYKDGKIQPDGYIYMAKGVLINICRILGPIYVLLLLFWLSDNFKKSDELQGQI